MTVVFSTYVNVPARVCGIACLLAVPSLVAANAAAACAGVDANGMTISGTRPFGHGRSGFVLENYGVPGSVNADVVFDADANIVSPPSVVLGAPAIKNTLNFDGYRIMDCRSGAFVAIGDTDRTAVPEILNNRSLRAAVGRQRLLSMDNIRPAVQQTYAARDKAGRSSGARYHKKTRIKYLQESAQPCGCKTYFPELWNAKMKATTQTRTPRGWFGFGARKKGTGQ